MPLPSSSPRRPRPGLSRWTAYRSRVPLQPTPLEARGAIHAPTGSRRERHHSRLAARAADDRRPRLSKLAEARSDCTCSAFAPARLACRTAHGAAAGWVEVAESGKRTTLVVRKCERAAAVTTGQHGVSWRHARVQPGYWERRAAHGSARLRSSRALTSRGASGAGTLKSVVPVARSQLAHVAANISRAPRLA